VVAIKLKGDGAFRLVSICLGLLAEACAASIAYTPWSFVKRSWVRCVAGEVLGKVRAPPARYTDGRDWSHSARPETPAPAATSSASSVSVRGTGACLDW